MAVEKSLEQQIVDGDDSVEGLAVEVNSPSIVTIDGSNVIEAEDGSVEVNFGDGEESQSDNFEDNLAEFMDDEDLDLLASDLMSLFDDDKSSRSEWESTYIDGLELLGISGEERTIPFEGACGVTHPILSEASIRFVSQSMMEIFPSGGPVKTKTVGTTDDDKISQAQRVQDYMNYLLVEEMPEYRSETEQLLFHLSLAGSAFRKVYYDPSLQRPASVFVPAEDFVASYATTDLVTSPRHTHVMKKSYNFVRKLQVSGFYRDIDLTESAGGRESVQAKYNEINGFAEINESDLRTILEMHVELELDGFPDTDENGDETGIALPYVITIDRESNTVLSIRRNYTQNDPLKRASQHFVHYKFQPGLGFYGFGLIHLIGSIAKSSTSILRQLIDAGTLANLPAGFKARGLRIKGDDTPIAPGEFRDIDLPSGAIRDNIMPLPFKDPSSTLAQLLGVLVEEGRRFASIADLNIGEGNQEAPVGTTLALIERSMKVMSAIHARLHSALKRELSLLSNLIAASTDQYPYESEGNPAEDFDGKVDIIPVSDPNATSFAQRMMQQQAAMQTAQQAPQLYDMRELHKRFLETAGVDDVDKIIPDKSNIPAYDPVTENARMMAGGPVRVQAYQDHESHISAHMSLMQSPDMAQNPMAKMIQGAVSAHISEHMAHKYRNEAEQMMGTALPPLEDKDKKGMAPEMEAQISRAAAQAAAQITGKAQQKAVLEQQMAAAQDPVIQQQQAELQIKQAQIAQNKAESELEARTDLQKTKMRNDLEEKRMLQNKIIAEKKMQVDLEKSKSKN
jgi:hypothetical protein